jgi:hypothetical protein
MQARNYIEVESKLSFRAESQIDHHIASRSGMPR